MRNFYLFCFIICNVFLVNASNLSVFDEAVELLKNFYYNQKTIAQKLNPKAIEACRKKINSESFEALYCLVNKIQDPYTKFLTPAEAKKEMKRIRKMTISTGLVLDPFDSSIVQEVQIHSSAYKAGIKPQDRILTINEIPIEILNEEEIFDLLNTGALDKKIKLDLNRNYLYFSATLSLQELPTIPLRIKTINPNIAYIKIDDLLTDNAFKEFHLALQKRPINSSSGLILDLRNNKGGLLSNGINIADEFLSKGLIVQTRSFQGKKEIYAKPNLIYTKPIIILINERTASASEVIASSLKDNNRALLIGNKSFGKGLIQQIKTLHDGSILHITVNKFYTPKDQEINKIGIPPHINIKETNAQLQEAILQIKKLIKQNKISQ